MIDLSGIFIQTHTNKKFYFDDFNEKDICIEDIAHALSNLCRFTGHSKYFYSVAQHSYYCSKLAEHMNFGPKIQLKCLLHDAAEFVIGDVSRPIKRILKSSGELLKIEDRIMSLILQKWLGSDEYYFDNIVKKIDNIMLNKEANILFSKAPKEMGWQDQVEEIDLERANKIKIRSWVFPGIAKQIFLDRFNELVKKIAREYAFKIP